MRIGLLTALMALIGPGCTSMRLERSVVNQAETLTDMQYEQVLANLAMTSKDLWVLPSQVSIRDGSSQVQDLGSASALFDVRVGTTSHPFVSGSRTVVEQWGVRPVANDTELKVLRMAYQRAAGHDVRLQYDADLTNDLAHEIKKQVVQPESLDFRLEEFYATRALGGETSRLLRIGDQSISDSERNYKSYIDYKRRVREARRAVELIDAGLRDPSMIIEEVRKNPKFGFSVKGAGDFEFKKELKIADGASPLDPVQIRAVRDSLGKFKQSFRVNFSDGFEREYGESQNELFNLIEEDVDLKLQQAGKASSGFNNRVLSSSDEQLILESEFYLPLSMMDPGRVLAEPERRVTPTVKEVRRQVKKLEDDLLKIPVGWYCIGKKPPRDAVAVGRHGDTYAWVDARNLRLLADFTLTVLSITDLIKEESIVTEPGGPRFSPTPAVGPAGRF